MPPITDRFGPGVHQRTEIAAFDHDCEGGHGPLCRRLDVTVHDQWVDLAGQPITDAEHIAFLEERRQKGAR